MTIFLTSLDLRSAPLLHSSEPVLVEVSLSMPGTPLLWTSKKCSATPVWGTSIFLTLMWSSHLTRLIGRYWAALLAGIEKFFSNLRLALVLLGPRMGACPRDARSQRGFSLWFFVSLGAAIRSSFEAPSSSLSPLPPQQQPPTTTNHHHQPFWHTSQLPCQLCMNASCRHACTCSCWRHEQQSIAMADAAAPHHSAGRSKKNVVERREEEEDVYETHVAHGD